MRSLRDRVPCLGGRLGHRDRRGTGSASLTARSREPARLPLLRPIRPDRDKCRVEKQRGQVDVIEITATERLEAFPELLTHPRGGRLRTARWMINEAPSQPRRIRIALLAATDHPNRWAFLTERVTATLTVAHCRTWADV